MWDFVMDKSGAGAGFLRGLRFPLHNLNSICFSTIIFTITRGWHNRPGVAAVPTASQTRIKKETSVMTGGVSVEIQIQYIPNISLKTFATSFFRVTIMKSVRCTVKCTLLIVEETLRKKVPA
jgi:hypothetical protein